MRSISYLPMNRTREEPFVPFQPWTHHQIRPDGIDKPFEHLGITSEPLLRRPLPFRKSRCIPFQRGPGVSRDAEAACGDGVLYSPARNVFHPREEFDQVGPRQGGLGDTHDVIVDPPHALVLQGMDHGSVIDRSHDHRRCEPSHMFFPPFWAFKDTAGQ